MKKFILIALISILIISVQSTYNKQLAKKLAYFSGATLAAQNQITSWTCAKYCTYSPLQSVKIFKNPILDVFGYTGYSAQENAVIVTFRSTISVQNWIVNLDANQIAYPNCDGCLVHQGFYNAYQSAAGYVRQNVQALLSQYRGAKIYVTGFSLGSALAVFGAVDLKNIFQHVDQFYSFGQPRIGNYQFANFFTQQISTHFRIIHYADLIPQLPPQIPLPYSHFAYEIWYDEQMSKFKQCGAQDYSCSKSLFPFQWTMNDHDIDKYILLSLNMNEKEADLKFNLKRNDKKAIRAKMI